ncbi:hypothetical protein [Paragemmobacter straminiformis]|uniref:Uncharacterized protein n=1 Tax=Paragemmobacter straminiformis TaxID=2045119 RepID=A0A842I7P4_9RHOB|nr:hypothetical protein [Gemmobacter straminiformis]MBC2835008.1 hypothetical protein [Gemmobacter straminiformis]
MPKPVAHFVVQASAKRRPLAAKRLRKPKLAISDEQPRDLWPSGRGTQIGHFRSSFTRLKYRLLNRLPEGTKAELFGRVGDDDFLELVLYGFGGETAITLFTEPSQAPEVVAIVADAQSDHARLLVALQDALGKSVKVITDPPETDLRTPSR